MRDSLTWMVGGQQGEGIDSTGEILASALNRLGYYIYGYRTFSSRIKGGHTNYNIRISTSPVRAMSGELDVLVAFDQDSIDRNAHLCPGRGIIVADSSKGELEAPQDLTVINVPLTDIARELGNTIVKNMVGVGASAAILGLSLEDLRPSVEEKFASRGEKILAINNQALERGYQAVKDHSGELSRYFLAKGDGSQRYLMSGDEAVAFGALRAGCRLLSAYPITPASEIMHWLVKKLPEHGGVVVQAEDEIAAITMATAAGFAGLRSMTSTSGPGFSLMQEALGYAGVIEAPVVIVDVQRGGPSTGMPTKHEQSDLYEMVYGSHGDLPRIVLSPDTVEDCFYDTVQAFNLAEKYQTPVIVGLDLGLGMCKQTVEAFDFNALSIDRGEVLDAAAIAKLQAEFKRYELTDSGISPRSIPGTPGGVYFATGVEHDPTGHISESPTNRVDMMNKRLRKIARVETSQPVLYEGPDEPELLLVTWGTASGAIQEAARVLGQETSTGHLRIRRLSPFPTSEVREIIASAARVVVVENNATGQLANHISQHLKDLDLSKLSSHLRYDGQPFIPAEVASALKEVI